MAQATAMPGGADTFAPSLGKKKLDKEKWVYVKDVPIFDEHDGSEEGLETHFTADVLKKIVEQNNGRLRDTGDMVPVTRGHTGGEQDPEVLGWASDFKMGSIGKDKRACIYCSMKFTPENYQKVKELAAGQPFPRRSIELWDDYIVDPIALTDRPILDTVALLGAERPARNLGLGEKITTQKYRYSIQDTKEHMDPQALQQIIDAVMSLPEFQYIRQCMSEQQAAQPMEKDGMDDGDGDESMDNNKPEAFEDEDQMEPAKLRLQRDQLKRQFAKLKAEYEAREVKANEEYKTLFAKVETLERKERLAHRKADLMQLEAEGFSFDLAEELETVADMELTRFQKHITGIKKNYRKAPVNVNVVPAPIPAEGGKPGVEILDRFQVLKQADARARDKYNREKI